MTASVLAHAGSGIAHADARPIGRDVRVSPDHLPGSYRRVTDGAIDRVHEACATGRRQQVEPAVAVHPRNLDVIVVGALDACGAVRHPVPIGQFQNWVAYYRSIDAGATWSAGLFPGYQGDASLRAECGYVVDPTMAFDRAGRLFFGGDCVVWPEQQAWPVDFHIAVATFEDDGSRLARVVRVDRPASAAEDPPQWTDKPNLVVDQTDGPFAGNVYVAWTECPRGTVPALPTFCPLGGTSVKVARSTDHGETFAAPVTVFQGADRRNYSFSDLAVGPRGVVHLTFRSTPAADGFRDIYVARSDDGAVSFTQPQVVDRLDSFDNVGFTGGRPPLAGGGDVFGDCGDGPYRCTSGFNMPVFNPSTAIAADEDGVHLVWNGRLEGQSKIFYRHSPDGLTWPGSARTIDTHPAGHQWLPDIASADGQISVVFYDSRADPHYAPERPPGNTAAGTSPGPSVDTYVATSRDGGRKWAERRLSDVSSEPNYETYHEARAPWRGDYLYVSAVPGGTFGVWTDSRDVVAGDDTRPDSADEGFDVHAPCTWRPNTVEAPPGGYATPLMSDGCLSQGGLDLNIYGTWIRRCPPPVTGPLPAGPPAGCPPVATVRDAPPAAKDTSGLPMRAGAGAASL